MRVDSAALVQGAVPGGQVGERRGVRRGEHRRRGAVLYLDQREPCDAIEVVGHGHPYGDGGRGTPRRGRRDGVGAVAPEPEVRQRFGQAGQRGVKKVVAQHAAGDQRRREVREGGGEDPGWIGEIRFDGEALGRQAGPLPVTTRPRWPLSRSCCSAAAQTPSLSKAAGNSGRS